MHPTPSHTRLALDRAYARLGRQLDRLQGLLGACADSEPARDARALLARVRADIDASALRLQDAIEALEASS